HARVVVPGSVADTAAVNCSQTSISTVSFAANRERSRSRTRRGVSRCAAARVLPCRSICSALNNSERSGSSSAGALGDEPRVPQRALNCVRCPRIDVLLVTESRCPFCHCRIIAVTPRFAQRRALPVYLRRHVLFTTLP